MSRVDLEQLALWQEQMAGEDVRVTADDVRRGLEIVGFESGVERNDLRGAVLDTYSEVFESSQGTQRDHELALLSAVIAAVPLLLSQWARSWDRMALWQAQVDDVPRYVHGFPVGLHCRVKQQSAYVERRDCGCGGGYGYEHTGG
jgi:hypothetical protein